MRRKKYIWAVAGALSLMQCISAYAGTWTQETWGETKKWIYTNDDGSTADYEWVKDNGDWYYCGRWGVMETNTSVDGYYIGADGRMISEGDTLNPLHGERICGTCYMKVNSAEDCGSYYKADVTLSDSSYYTNDELNQVGDVGSKIWIEARGDYGKISRVDISTSGDMGIEVKYGNDTYYFTQEDAIYTPYKGEEETLTRKVKDTEVLIPKNVEIIPTNGFEVYKATLDTFVNEKMARLVPVFNGNTVRVLYDDIINYAD